MAAGVPIGYAFPNRSNTPGFLSKGTTSIPARGYFRVEQIDVSISLRLHEQEQRMQRRPEIFEKYCVVTGAVRKGIPVNISVDTGE